MMLRTMLLMLFRNDMLDGVLVVDCISGEVCDGMLVVVVVVANLLCSTPSSGVHVQDY